MGRKRAAVLVGCNYKGTLAELKACVNDVWAMHATLCKRFHFDEADIQVLVDNDPTLTMPTGANIRRALCTAIASTSSPGDTVFFHFSGHGIRLPPPNVRGSAKLAPSQYDECIVPCDMNLLTDEDIREVVNLLPEGVTFTIVADSCSSGGLIKYEKEQIGDSFTHVATSSINNFCCGESEHNSKSIAEMYKTSIVVGSSRSLPITNFLKILNGQNKENNINISNVRHSLVTMFKEESSIKFRKVLTPLSSLTCTIHSKGNKFQSNSCILRSCCQKAISKSSINLLNVKYDKASCENNAILISACQAYETAQDVMPSCSTSKGEAGALTRSPFGAMSYAILDVLSQLDLNEEITNFNLVVSARRLIAKCGLTHQHPGLYCCDNYVNAPFISSNK
ncbi:hypothetical protein L7F22_045913 [Adiantum nelumboides]|nr:hypothetical protein [Adiantum nelumboides]